MVFEGAEEEELIVSDEPEVLEVELQDEEGEEEEESMEVNDEEQADVSSIMHLLSLVNFVSRIQTM